MKTVINFRNSQLNGQQQFPLAAAWKKFDAYATAQEPNRLIWTAISILGHGTVFTIGTLVAVMMMGNPFFLLVPTCLNMTIVLAVNLAAMPTRYTVPVFFLSLIIDLAIIASVVMAWLS